MRLCFSLYYIFSFALLCNCKFFRHDHNPRVFQLPVFQKTMVPFLSIVVLGTRYPYEDMPITSFNPCLLATRASSSFAFAYLAFLAMFNLCSGVKDLDFLLFLCFGTSYALGILLKLLRLRGTDSCYFLYIN